MYISYGLFSLHLSDTSSPLLYATLSKSPLCVNQYVMSWHQNLFQCFQEMLLWSCLFVLLIKSFLHINYWLWQILDIVVISLALRVISLYVKQLDLVNKLIFVFSCVSFDKKLPFKLHFWFYMQDLDLNACPQPKDFAPPCIGLSYPFPISTCGTKFASSKQWALTQEPIA